MLKNIHRHLNYNVCVQEGEFINEIRRILENNVIRGK